jgi:iron complex outermembrane receptor protein
MLCWAAAATVLAQTTNGSGGEMDPESLLFFDVPIVVTATRTATSAMDVPSAVTVISAEEIRASGARSVPEALEIVPGLDIVRVSKSDVHMSARGFNEKNSSRLLVMVDGRSVFVDFFGTVTWDRINVVMEDIDRIEVVLGPGSALYGANAFLGTVNIITKQIDDVPRLEIYTGIGNEATQVSAIGAQRSGRLGIKGSVEYRAEDFFRNRESTDPWVRHGRGETDLRGRKINTTIDYALPNDGRLSFSTGYGVFSNPADTGIATFMSDTSETFAKVNVDRGPWKLQAWYKRLDLDTSTVPSIVPLSPQRFEDRLVSNTVDFEAQRELELGRHHLLAGFNVKRLSTRAPNIFGSREEETIYSGFFEDAIEITEWATAFVGARLDQHPKTGENISPQGSLVFRIGENNRARVSFKRSFRNPTQVGLYSTLNFATAGPFTLFTLNGNEDLDPVWVTAYEVGFQTRAIEGLVGRLDLFYSVIEDFHTFVPVVVGPPAIYTFVNEDRTSAWGGEASLEYRWSDALRSFANYSFQSANGPSQGLTPRHKASGGVRGTLWDRLRYALTAVYVGHHRYDARLGAGDVDSRFSVNANLAWRLTDHLELGVHARNIFHQVQSEIPGGDEIGSELLATAQMEF